MKNVSDVLDSIQGAWNAFSDVQLEKAFCTLNLVFEQVVLHYGDNCYALPHINKAAIWKKDGVSVLHACQASRTNQTIVMEFFLGNI